MVFSLIWCLKRSSSRQSTCMGLGLLAKWFWKCCFRGKTKKKLFQLQKLIYKNIIKLSESSVFLMNSFKMILYFNWNYSGWIYAFLCHLWQISVVLLWLEIFFFFNLHEKRKKEKHWFHLYSGENKLKAFHLNFHSGKKVSKSLLIWRTCWKWLLYFTIKRKAFLHLCDKFQHLNFFFSFIITNCCTSCKINFYFQYFFWI